MRRFLTVLLALCLLAGCGPQLDRFPRVETTAPTYPAQTLTIDIPLGADQFTQDGVAQLAAAVLELSGGAGTLEAIPSQNPAAALSNGATHLALLDNRQLLEADPSMVFLDWPFLLEDAGQWLTVMGAEDGVVRGSASLQKALNGEVIGLWYGGRAVLLCRGNFYEAISFAGTSLGMLEDHMDTGFFQGIGEDLGAKILCAGDPAELMALFDQKEIKYMELFLDDLDPDALPEALKYLEDTTHRVEGLWLVLGKDAVDGETARLLRAAAASVPQTVWDARARQEEDLFQALEDREVEVRHSGYNSLHRAARDYFRHNGERLGCTSRTLEELLALVR